MKPARLSACCLVFLLALIHAADAQEQKFEKYNFAITPPEGWNQRSNVPGAEGLDFAVAFVSPDGKQVLLVSADDSSSIKSTNDESIGSFNRGFQKAGGGPVSGNYITMDGVKAYQETSVANIKGKNISFLIRMAWVDRYSYILEAMANSSDPGGMPEVRKSMDSFHFLTQPEMPAQSESDATTQRQEEEGRTGFYTALVVGGAFLLIFLVHKGRKKTPPPPPFFSKPPPMPRKVPPPPPMPPGVS